MKNTLFLLSFNNSISNNSGCFFIGNLYKIPYDKNFLGIELKHVEFLDFFQELVVS